VRARFIGIAAVVVSNDFAGMLQVISRFLGRVVISSPFHSVLQAGASSATAFPTGIQDIFYHPFLESINFNGWRRVMFLSGQGVIGSRAEQVDMEHRVDPHRGGQI
jgi:hypothetical protein